MAIIALLAVIAFAPSAFGAKQSTMDVVRSALHISKRADKNAAKALKPVDSKRIKDGAVHRRRPGRRHRRQHQARRRPVTSDKIADGT